jgi:two-component system sensor histidine kinase RegB
MERIDALTRYSPATAEELGALLGLRWLITIRWVAFASYALIFIAARWLVDFEAHHLALLFVVLAGVVSNAALYLVPVNFPNRAKELMGVAILFDVLLLAVMLYLCGGFTNPFSMMFLVYVTLAAFFLDERWTWGVFALATASFLALFFFHVAVPQLDMHAHHGHTSGVSLHLHGMLIAFVVIGVIISSFVTRMSSDLRLQERELAELKERERERRQLLSLATITAGAAHELATPLSTVSLIAEELVSQQGLTSHLQEDLCTMRQEVERCNEVLRKMRGGSSELQGEAPTVFSVESVVDELKSAVEYRGRVAFFCSAKEVGAMFSLRAALLSSLRALIKNSLQAAPNGSVSVSVQADLASVRFTVCDDGVGIGAEDLQRVGEPFFTSKTPGEGMGLGVYLVKLFVSQLEGEFSLSSVAGSGTNVSFVVPRNMNI